MTSKEIIELPLKIVINSDTGKGIITLGMVSSIVMIKGGHVGFIMQFISKEEHNYGEQILKWNMRNALKAIPNVTKITVVEAIEALVRIIS